MMTMQDFVVGAALVAGLLCMIIFAWGAGAAILAIKTQAPALAPDSGGQRALGVDELAKLFDAITKLTDSLAKAGPTISALVGGLGFFAIAAAMVK